MNANEKLEKEHDEIEDLLQKGLISLDEALQRQSDKAKEVYATADAPGSIDLLLVKMAELGIDAPLADFMYIYSWR